VPGLQPRQDAHRREHLTLRFVLRAEYMKGRRGALPTGPAVRTSPTASANFNVMGHRRSLRHHVRRLRQTYA